MENAYVMITLSYNRLMSLCAVVFLAAVILGCGRSERMDALYAQRCLGCHGAVGKGDGQVAALLPVPVPDFRQTVERKSTGQIRRIITEGKGLMPAFDPALKPGEINDAVRMVLCIGAPVHNALHPDHEYQQVRGRFKARKAFEEPDKHRSREAHQD